MLFHGVLAMENTLLILLVTSVTMTTARNVATRQRERRNVDFEPPSLGIIRAISTWESADKGWISVPVARAKEQLPVDFPPPESSSVSQHTPRIIHYVWCSQDAKARHFQFLDFLSMRSAIYFLVPDLVYFHYDVMPATDGYDTWLRDVNDTYPFLLLVPDARGSLCRNGSVNISAAGELLHSKGGALITFNTILAEVPPHSPGGSEPSLKIERPVEPEITSGLWLIPQASTSVNSPTSPDPPPCVSIENFNNGYWSHAPCIHVTKNDVIEPRDLLTTDQSTKFTKLSRVLMYGDPDLQKAKSYETPVIPRIAHYPMFGQRTVSATFYLSILSALRVANLDAVYIYGDKEPVGEKWEKIHTENRVKFIRRTLPTHLYGKSVIDTQHQNDVIMTDVILKYGGLHVNRNWIFLKPVPDVLFHHEAVISVDHNDTFSGDLPQGQRLSMGMANSNYWRTMQLYQRRYTEQWSGSLALYKVYERKPESVYNRAYPHGVCNQTGCQATTGGNVTTYDDTWGLSLILDEILSVELNSLEFTPPEMSLLELIRKKLGLHDIGPDIL